MVEVDTNKPLARIHYTRIVSFGLDGTNPCLQQNSEGLSYPVMFKSWRVVAIGLYISQAGLTGEDPLTYFGVEKSDLRPKHSYYFGAIVQDPAAGKQFEYGDTVIADPLSFLAAPDALQNGGSPSLDTAAGGGFLKWHQKGTIITVERENDHQLGIVPIVCIEVKN